MIAAIRRFVDVASRQSRQVQQGIGSALLAHLEAREVAAVVVYFEPAAWQADLLLNTGRAAAESDTARG
ncbi:hypothetical protein DY468_00095 [Rhodopseudomonas sp. BR0M22]|nr:hypothetical protein [Rhodopseudomonas sp. BR0M22]